VWIGPFEFGHRAFQLDGLVTVELGGERMMSESGRCEREYQDGQSG
jgi:hypothetical protein